MNLLGPYLAAALLLVVAGAQKVRDPGDVATAINGWAHRSPRAVRCVVRAGAAFECAIGLAAIARPAPVTAAAVALSYLAFALYVAWLRVGGGPLATCGCFGTADAAPTWTHVAVDVLLAVAAVGVSTASGGWLPTLLARQPADGWPLLLAAATAAFLAFAVLSVLARVEGARRLYRGVA
jgi:hypothetical protein